MVTQKAGCVLINPATGKIGLIYRLKHDDYSFPKGHMEAGETIEQCAVRETEEETGRCCEIIRDITLPTLTYTSSKGKHIQAHYFLAVDTGESNRSIEPHLVHTLIWTPLDKVGTTLSHQNLITFWEQVLPVVQKIMNKK